MLDISREGYSTAEVMMSTALEELLRTEHSIRNHNSDVLGRPRLFVSPSASEFCDKFPCRFIIGRLNEADKLIHANKSWDNYRKDEADI